MISHIFEQKKIVYSIEVFPPKKADDIHLVYQAIDEMKQCCPDFISVTYGAGGGTSKETLAIASYIKNQCHIESLAHLTCAALTAEELEGFVGKFKEHSLSNVLALRGDKPKAMDQAIFDQRYYKYASDLVRALQGNDFCIAGACYPEKHPDVATMEEDIDKLKQKGDK